MYKENLVQLISYWLNGTVPALQPGAGTKGFKSGSSSGLSSVVVADGALISSLDLSKSEKNNYYLKF